jgi:hypothetical protein
MNHREGKGREGKKAMSQFAPFREGPYLVLSGKGLA